MFDDYFNLAAEHFGYQPGAPIAKQDMEVLALAVFMRANFGPLRNQLAETKSELESVNRRIAHVCAALE